MKKKTESQIKSDKKGAERIKQYENRNKKEENVEDNSGKRSIKCFQKKEPGEWEEITYYYDEKEK